jgi:hypothetical protein
MGVRLIPVSNDRVAALLQAGRTVEELAEEWGVQPQTVRKASRAAGHVLGYENFTILPIRVAGPRAHAPAARGLRFLARIRAGETLPPVNQVTFENWKKERDAMNEVVEYREDYPPNPASPTYGGWYYAKRRPDTPPAEYFQEASDIPRDF